MKTYRTTGTHINWLQPRWEYMHYHPNIWDVDLNVIGIWEAEGKIVGVAHLEHYMGSAYFEFDPAYDFLRREALAYAEENLRAVTNDKKVLSAYINDQDTAFQAIAAEKGYQKQSRSGRMSRFVIPHPFPAITLPDGFQLRSLVENNDLYRLCRLLYRGFGHGEELPDDDDVTDGNEFMQSAPNYQMDINIVIEAPDGGFAAYCGMWYEPVNRIAYVEPVATDPDYRRMGLASAAVLEGIRRCAARGATVAYVGSILPIYLSLGFAQMYNCSTWLREWP
ncbi:MAG: GNAT family N-acetyltransferase [Chloroflexi bacterium]|nr:GNAT family N-acetyltransferase [Chloroflexota bacterium]